MRTAQNKVSGGNRKRTENDVDVVYTFAQREHLLYKESQISKEWLQTWIHKW